jgi:hypothetical protein
MRKLLAAAIFAALAAQAQQVNTFRSIPAIDLDKPGALAALEQENPADYRRVMQTVRRAERMDCRAELQLYRAGVDLKGGPCPSYLIGTSYPAKTLLSVLSGNGIYTITVYIDPAADRMTPAR